MKFFTLTLLLGLIYNAYGQNLNYYLGTSHYARGNLKTLGEGLECIWNNPSGIAYSDKSALSLQYLHISIPEAPSTIALAIMRQSHSWALALGADYTKAGAYSLWQLQGTVAYSQNNLRLGLGISTELTSFPSDNFHKNYLTLGAQLQVNSGIKLGVQIYKTPITPLVTTPLQMGLGCKIKLSDYLLILSEIAILRGYQLVGTIALQCNLEETIQIYAGYKPIESFWSFGSSFSCLETLQIHVALGYHPNLPSIYQFGTVLPINTL